MKKSIDIILKDLDEKKGIVSAYFALFDIEDLDGDFTRKGNFTKTFKERGPQGSNKIKLFKNHETKDVYGGMLELYTDEKGAAFVSKVSEASFAKDLMIQYREGLITEHSYMFEPIIYNQRKDKKGYEFLESIVYEISAIPFMAAQPLAQIIDVKSFKSEKEALRILDFVEKSLNVPDFSDAYFKKLEKLSIAITAAISRPQEVEPEKTTQKEAPAAIDWQKVFSNL